MPSSERGAFLARPQLVYLLEPLVQGLAARADQLGRSKPPQALEVATTALEAAHQANSPMATGYANRANANALRIVGRFEESLPFYKEAIAAFKLAKLPAEEGRTYLGELAALSNLGRYADALRYGDIIRRRLARLGDKLNQAKLASTLAIIHHHTGRYQHSVRLHNRSLQLFKELNMAEMLPPGLLNRANTLTQLNRFRQAEQDYETCREEFTKRGQTALLAFVDINMGFLLFRQGRYQEALTLLAAAIEGFEATGQQDKRALAELDLAFCYSALNLHNEALTCFQQAGEAMQTLNMRYEAVRVEIGRVEVLLNRGKYQQAGQRLTEVEAVYNQAEDSERNRHALAVIWLYQAYLLTRTTPQDAKEATELVRRARETFQDLKLAYWQAQAQIIEAEILHLAGKVVEAEEAFLAAAKPVRRLKLPHLLYQLHYGYGRLKQAGIEKAGEDFEKSKLTDAALAEYLKAAEQVESMRAILRPEELRVAFMENGLKAYEAMVELCLQDSRRPDRAYEAFNYVERSKSRSLLDLLSHEISQVQTPAGESEGEGEEENNLAGRVEQLRQELNWFYSQVHNIQAVETSEENSRQVTLPPAQVAQEIGGRERELATLLRRYRPGLLAEPAGFRPGDSTGLVEELRQALQPGQTLVEYYALGDKLMAFVLDRENFTLVPDLAELEQVNELQERLNYQADKFNLGRGYVERRLAVLRRDYDFYLGKLYMVLIEPLLPHLNGSSLVIVPHGNLHTLPFHALFDGQSYLAERFEISYAPSARVLLHCLTQQDRPYRKLLGLAVPDELLTGVEKEVRLLGDLFAETRLLVGPDATLPALQQNLAWCDVLHLASHGVFREDNPLFSLLKLADGWLSVQDVMDWRFQPSLVTLSACQTGLSRPLFGDELLGLARGFLSAGASSLVVSLWSVNDEVTTQLMQYFYEALLAGQNRAASLQTAMRKLRSESPYTHPHYWAPFVLVGRP
ncbi:MAG: CHAT domain-containing protein [Chloroflexi bacterium]|nr:CHAT domain-containing protein [Chloroflexota bacterium]OJV87048.1 MAG: hypothetical protein BGO39_33330 [Chloroflexi bacterium 54-19]